MDFDHLAHTIQDSDSVYVLYSCVDGRVNMVRVHVHVHVHESGDNIKGVKKKTRWIKNMPIWRPTCNEYIFSVMKWHCKITSKRVLTNC